MKDAYLVTVELLRTMLTTVVGEAVKVFCFLVSLSVFHCQAGDTYSLVGSNSSSNSNRGCISSSLCQIPRIDLCSSSSTNICQSSLDAGVSLRCISRNVNTSRDLNQARPSAAWRVRLLGAGRNCAAGCCSLCVDDCSASPGLDGAGETDGLGAYDRVGGDCDPACGL